jgi:hypothetical protein
MSGPKLVEGPPFLRVLPPPLAHLGQFRRFCLWDPNERDASGRQKKSPRRCSDPSRFASTKRPDTLGTFAEAQAAMALSPTFRVGYVLTQDDEIAYLDLDGCRNPETNEVSPWALRLIDEGRTYTEITPSGTGIRMIGLSGMSLASIKAVIPAELLGAQDDDAGRSSKRAQLEIFYHTVAYVTVSGWRFPGTESWGLGPIGHLTQRLAALAPPTTASAHVPNPDKELSDEDLAACAEAIPNPVPGIEGGDSWDGVFLHVGLAFWLASNGSDAGLAAFLHWSAKNKEKHIEWRSLDAWDNWTNRPPDRIAGGSLINWSNEEAVRRSVTFLQPSRHTPKGGWPPLNPAQIERLILQGVAVPSSNQVPLPVGPPPPPVFVVGQDHMPRLSAVGPVFTPSVAAAPAAPFALLSPTELLARYGEKPRFVIDAILTEGTTAMVNGLPGAGKSPLVQAWAVHAATGIPWCGHAVRQVKVAYIAAESARQTAINLAEYASGLLEIAMGLPMGSVALTEGLKIIDNTILAIDADLTLEADTPRLIDSLQSALRPGGRWAGEEMGVIVVDTLRAASSGAVTSDEDMRVVQARVADIRAAFPKAVIIILHHAAKASPAGSSGSNRLDGMSETIFSIQMVRAGEGIDCEVVLSRADQYGPGPDGWRFMNAKLVMGRNKTWETMQPVLVEMAVRESSIRFSFNGDNKALSDAAAAAFKAMGKPLGGVFKDETGTKVRVKATVTLVPGTPLPQEGDDGAFASGQPDSSVAEMVVEAPARAHSYGAEAARALVSFRPGAEAFHTVADTLAWFRAEGIADPDIRVSLGVGASDRRGAEMLTRRYRELEQRGRAESRPGTGKTVLWRVIKVA